MKIRLAQWLRKRADRLDPRGAPRRTSWSFTFEPGWGTVFNQEGRGCPLWYYGLDDYGRAHGEHKVSLDGGCDDVQWAAVGFKTPTGVSVIGSAEVSRAQLSRRVNGHDVIEVPRSRAAKVPRWQIGVQLTLDSWVNVPGRNFQEAVERAFGRPGTRH